MVKEARNIWWDYISVLGSKVMSFPLSLIYISLVTRNLGPERWGIVMLFTSVYQLLFSLGINWTSSAVVRFGKEEFVKEGHLRKTVAARFAIIAIMLSLFLFLIFLFRKTLTGYIGIPLQTFWLISLMLLAYSFNDFLAWILKAIGLMKQFAVFLVLRHSFLIVSIIIFLIADISLSVQRIISLEIVSYLLISVFCIFFLKFKYFFPIEKDLVQLKKMLIYSWPLSISFLFGYASNWMDVFFVKYFFSTYRVGIYQAAYRMMVYISAPLTTICVLAFPLLVSTRARKRNDIAGVYVKSLTPQFSFFWNIIVSSLIVVSGYLIRIGFGSLFVEAIFPFSLLLLAVGFQGVSTMYSSVFCAFDWLRYHTIIIVTCTLLKFIGNLFLVPRFGILGAAISTSLAYSLGAIFYLIVANNLMAIKTYKALIYPFITALFLLFFSIIGNLFLKILLGIFALFSFVFLAKYTKTFSADNIHLLEKIEMPDFLRKGMSKVYLLLS